MIFCYEKNIFNSEILLENGIKSKTIMELGSALSVPVYFIILCLSKYFTSNCHDIFLLEPKGGGGGGIAPLLRLII